MLIAKQNVVGRVQGTIAWRNTLALGGSSMLVGFKSGRSPYGIHCTPRPSVGLSPFNSNAISCTRASYTFRRLATSGVRIMPLATGPSTAPKYRRDTRNACSDWITWPDLGTVCQRRSSGPGWARLPGLRRSFCETAGIVPVEGAGVVGMRGIGSRRTRRAPV